MSFRRALLLLPLALVAVWLVLDREVARRGSSLPPAEAAAADATPAPADLAAPALVAEDPSAERVALEPETHAEPAAAPASFEALGDDEAVLQVRVLALESGRALGGVPLRLETPEGELVGGLRLLGRHRAAETDAQGRCDVAVPARRELVLHANHEHPAAGPSARQIVKPLEPHQYRTIVIELVSEPQLEWYGRVVDAETLAPVPHARLSLAGGAVRMGQIFNILCDAQGGVHLELDGARELAVESPGYAPRVHPIVPGHEQPEREERVELLRPAELEVVVASADGRALADLDVSLETGGAGDLALLAAHQRFDLGDREGEYAARTDADGRCELRGLPPLTLFDVEVRQADFIRHRQRLEPVLAPRERRSLRIELGPSGTITGCVRDQAGEPVAGLTILLAPRLEKPQGRFRGAMMLDEARTDAQGCFRFEDVPGGDWSLVAQPRDTIARGGDPDGATFAPQDVRVADGAATSALELSAWRGLAITGSVLDSDGRSITEGHVRAISDEGEVLGRILEDGSFAIGPLLPGRYRLRAYLPQRSLRPVEVEAQAGATGVVLTFEPPAGAPR